jgi:hypothetical protein
MSGPNQQHPENDLPSELIPLVRRLDARGAASRGSLTPEALERMASLSEMQLPMAESDAPVVIARIGASPRTPAVHWALRVAAAVAAAAVVGGAAWVLSRGSDEAPAPGTLVQKQTEPTSGPDESGALAGLGERAVPSAIPAAIPAAMFERVLSHVTGLRSASGVVVALSGSASDPAVHFHDVDDSLAADIAPIFHSGTLLDGGGTTYDDLSGEFAAIVASMPMR